MANDSTTGGFLLPSVNPAPLEGKALLRFFQPVFAGITGLPGNMVRPYWQQEPPSVPQDGVAWMAFTIKQRPADEFPFIGRYDYLGAQNLCDSIQRHEHLEFLCEFYDLGSTGELDSGGFADLYSSLLRDGLAIPQNREPFVLAGMNLAKMGTQIAAPVIFKGRWQYRVDLDFVINRQIDRVYPVETLESATGELFTDVGLPPQPFSTKD